MGKKEFRAPQCIHMPAPENTVIVHTTKRGELYSAGFTIGVQHFSVTQELEQDQAQWHCDMLETAFKLLVFATIPKECKGPSSIKAAKEFYRPQVTVTNLR